MPPQELDGHSLYLQGEDAVATVIEELRAQIKAMAAELQELRDQVAKNSGNSSKPPSSDGLKKPALSPMSLRKKSGKKPGGQQGRPGKTMEAVPNPDVIVSHRPSCCGSCQRDLAGAPVKATCSRQVHDMPAPKIIVTEHQLVTVTCPGCGKDCRSEFPAGVEQPVQYGPNILGMAAYLHSAHLLPFHRCAEVIRDLTGASFSPGTLHRTLKSMHNALEPFENAVKAALQKAMIQHADETGARTAGKLHWIHVRATERLAFLFRHEKRGGVAVDDLADFAGTLVSDYWSSYVKLVCSHVFCGAHMLRDLKFEFEQHGQVWAGKLIAVLEGALAACHEARSRGEATVSNAQAFEVQYDWLVREGLRCNPPPEQGKATKASCLAMRLYWEKENYLRFLHDLSMPFTNNEAERDLRMFKVKGKISGCFRTKQGADWFCRARSYIMTLRKQKMDVLNCMTNLFRGDLVMPALGAE